MVHTSLFHVGVLGLSVVVATALSVYAVRSRQVPGRLLFALFMTSVAVWAGAYGAGLLVQTREMRVALEAVTWLGRATVPVWIFLFALAYTGYDRFVTRYTGGGLLALPAVMIALVWTHPWNDLVWATTPRVVFYDGLALVVAGLGPLYWLFVVYAYVLILAAAVALVRLIFLSEHLYLDQSALLLVGIAAPFVGNALTVLPPHPVPGFDYTPYGFAVTGVAFSYSLFRRRLFELVPATRQLGRDAAIRQLEEGVVIVDADTRVIYCNPTAAEMLDCDPRAAIGEPVRSFVTESALDFGTEDALAEWERDDGVYEVRTSPIRDRGERQIGHTLVIQDVTARKRRERQLARQREELERLDDLNALIRGVNRALVSATDRAGIEQAVCDRLVDSDLFEMACAADTPTWNGTADRWTVAGGVDSESRLPEALDRTKFDLSTEREQAVSSDEVENRGGWIVIPMVYGRTVYGALGLYTRREPATDGGEIRERERAVLAELGELLGHAINAVENRRLLAADAVVELEFRSRDAADPFIRAASDVDAELTVTGLVTDGNASHLAYVRVSDGRSDAAEALSAVSGTEVSAAREADTDAMLEWSVPEQSILGTLVDHGGNVLDATADGDAGEFVVEVAADTDIRALVERVEESFPGTNLVAKRERERSAERTDSLPDDAFEELTERQQEALEVAYRAGYFEWPRENTAEDVAETLEVASPTFHYHLRQAEGTILDAMFEGNQSE